MSKQQYVHKLSFVNGQYEINKILDVAQYHIEFRLKIELFCTFVSCALVYFTNQASIKEDAIIYMIPYLHPVAPPSPFTHTSQNDYSIKHGTCFLHPTENIQVWFSTANQGQNT